jgi:hypothetical protein
LQESFIQQKCSIIYSFTSVQYETVFQPHGTLNSLTFSYDWGAFRTTGLVAAIAALYLAMSDGQSVGPTDRAIWVQPIPIPINILG